ncbi:MAG TPA: TIR domain-containing protein [Verrucomicrobiae bacterium]|nr:TIR domain-containing protein [Verrucomicrobiae bacterium]
MYPAAKLREIRRLINAFEAEADKFHEISFETFLIVQGGPVSQRKFSPKNHTVMLWQYYGPLDSSSDKEDLILNFRTSHLKFGLRGAQLSLFGVIEGEATEIFARMAMRAGALFGQKEAAFLEQRIVSVLSEMERSSKRVKRPVEVTNSNPLALWLNFLLYHISMSTGMEPEPARKIAPDPFTLSLVALERLLEDQAIGKVDRSTRKLSEINFKVALSFPGEKRRYVSRVAKFLRERLGKDSVFYDLDYQSQLAQPNLDVLLQKIYRTQSELIVVFLCAQYNIKQWCGLELRSIRDIIKSKEDTRVMPVRFDDAHVEGFFSVDGYINARKCKARQVSDYILQRLAVVSPVGKQSK